MLNHRADCAHHQRGPRQDEPEICCANRSSDSACGRNWGVVLFFAQTTAIRPIRQKIHFARSGARNPDPHRKEHDQDEQAHDLERMAPTKASHQKMN